MHAIRNHSGSRVGRGGRGGRGGRINCEADLSKVPHLRRNRSRGFGSETTTLATNPVQREAARIECEPTRLAIMGSSGADSGILQRRPTANSSSESDAGCPPCKAAAEQPYVTSKNPVDSALLPAEFSTCPLRGLSGIRCSDRLAFSLGRRRSRRPRARSERSKYSDCE
jgi:hypothetical protein